MKRIAGIVAAGVVAGGLVAGCGTKAPEQAAESPAGAVAPAQAAAYECPMCKVGADKPGKCPKCGMAMVPTGGKR